MVNRFALALAGALLAPIAAAAPAAAGTTWDPVRDGGPSVRRPISWAVGDSTMARAEHAYRDKKYRGELDGIGGRLVEDLISLTRKRVAAVGPTKKAIIGLGTNSRSNTTTKGDYLLAIRLLKHDGAKVIVLIAPHRDKRWGDWWRVEQRRQWMLDIAKKRKGVCVADAGGYAIAHPQVMNMDEGGASGLHWKAGYLPLFAALVMQQYNGPCR